MAGCGRPLMALAKEHLQKHGQRVVCGHHSTLASRHAGRVAHNPNSPILFPPKPYLVLRDTLCSCEAYGMRPMCKEKKNRCCTHLSDISTRGRIPDYLCTTLRDSKKSHLRLLDFQPLTQETVRHVITTHNRTEG